MQIKVWIESNSPSALPCYHVILKTSIIAAPTPSSWNVKRVRFRGTRCWCVLSNYACMLDWCHLPGDDDALIMRCCLKASFLLHTALPNETGELYRFMVYPCPNRSVYFSVGSPGWWKLVIVQAGVPSWSRWRDAPLVREFWMWSFPCKQTASRWFHGRKMRFCGMWSTTSVNTFQNISNPTHL